MIRSLSLSFLYPITLLLDSSSSYPVNSEPVGSTSSNEFRSFVEILTEANFSFDASLPRCCCSFIKSLKPSSSIVNPFSLAITFVRSTGKPNVSYSLKISSPGIIFSFSFLSPFIRSSNNSMPRSRVTLKLSSSALITFFI